MLFRLKVYITLQDLTSLCLPLTREVGEARRERHRTEILLKIGALC